jgi:hypothetical protein
MIDPDVESEIKDTVELAEDESKNIKINSPVKATGISSDVSARDLLKEIKEIEKIIRERQRG